MFLIRYFYLQTVIYRIIDILLTDKKINNFIKNQNKELLIIYKNKHNFNELYKKAFNRRIQPSTLKIVGL